MKEKEDIPPSGMSFSWLRSQIVGIDSFFDTPFGERLLVYCDYNASGRCLKFIERYIMKLQRTYANTHTEDDITGRNMSAILHQAEYIIKKSVNAGPGGKLVSCGFGSTAAIEHFQRIVGVRLPPATRDTLFTILREYSGIDSMDGLEEFIENRQPVVFYSSYEHHSNELSWRESLSTSVRVRLDDEGHIDLRHLEELLSSPEYEGRLKIGSFSAASNVTGVRTPVHEIAEILHRHGAYACFDFAAAAPYVQIDMNPESTGEGDPSIDAMFISPHKFLGGPGSPGLLIFNEKLYRSDLPPSFSGGGTVEYVRSTDHNFVTDIEEREKAGTPGVLQTLKAALAFEVKDTVTPARIEARENELLSRALAVWGRNPTISILGNPDPDKQIAIVSFNVEDPWGSHLHPKFITVILNDLFGIQSRAGCACAGPYGHYLLGIDEVSSDRFRSQVIKGHCGIKPGWCRIGFHYSLDDPEADYIIEAVDFIARCGYAFLQLYEFDLDSGLWNYAGWNSEQEEFGLKSAAQGCVEDATGMPKHVRTTLYRSYLDEAAALFDKLKEEVSAPEDKYPGELGELQYFSVISGKRAEH